MGHMVIYGYAQGVPTPTAKIASLPNFNFARNENNDLPLHQKNKFYRTNLFLVKLRNYFSQSKNNENSLACLANNNSDQNCLLRERKSF